MIIHKNLPNYLTISRIFIIPAIIASFYFEDSKWARQLGGGLFLIASITDFLDGYIARKYNLVSPFGKMFDPIADKVLVGCVIVMLVKYNRANEVPCLLILAREFAVAGLREFLAQIRISVPVTQLAKLKTVMQMVALSLLIVGSVGSGIGWVDQLGGGLLWLTAILTIVTGYSYLKSSSAYF